MRSCLNKSSGIRLAACLCVALMPLRCAPSSQAPESPSADLASAIDPDEFGDILQSANQQYFVAFRTTPDPIPLNEPFQMHVRVFDNSQPPQPVEGVDLSVDARMPHHRHGMNREPMITRLQGGEFIVQNMLLHMPGYWELYFDIERDGVTERAQTSVELE